MARGSSVVVLVIFAILALHRPYVYAALQYGYYAKSCPRLEEIVKAKSREIYERHGNFAVSSLRNLFHDCAAQGCDASILLDSSPGNPSEKESDNNFGQRNYKHFDVIKSVVEMECPNTVSCADILMLAGREGVINLGGPSIPIKTGRLDSFTSSKSIADVELVAKDADLGTVITRFADLGLNTEYAVAMLGAHTVGRTHCRNLVQRLYPTVDPVMNGNYSLYLKNRCKSPITNDKAVEYSRNDRVTPMGFDNSYFKLILDGKGHLQVDSDLSLDERTSSYVKTFAADNAYFYKKFSEATQILTEYKPLTGTQGEIRKVCKFVNKK